jgi:hypothetical protein
MMKPQSCQSFAEILGLQVGKRFGFKLEADLGLEPGP